LSEVKLGKLLVAIDGSENSDYALNIAIKIGEKYGSHVDLVHVRRPPDSTSVVQVVDPVVGGTTMIIPSQVLPSESDHKKETTNLLQDRLKVLRESSQIEGNSILRNSSDVAGEILRLVNTGNYDMVVLGSRGLSGLKSMIMGSVSTKVAKEAKCTVLVMKTRIDSLLKILLGYEGSDESKKALSFLCDFARKFNARVDPFAVVNVPLSAEGMIGTEMSRWEKEMREQVDHAESSLRACDIEATGLVRGFIDVARGLTEEAEEGSYNLIAVGSRGIGKLRSLFLGSVASGVSNSSKTNILIVR